MSLYTKMVSGALFPLHERFKGHNTVAVMRTMERSQWLSAREVKRLQITRLREFLSRVGTSVPHYRELSAADFPETGVRVADDGTLSWGAP